MPKMQPGPELCETSLNQANNEPTLVLPPLNFVKLSKVQPVHQFYLADQGWSTITFDDDDKLSKSSRALFAACKTFFDLPESYKRIFKSKLGSEEGWNYVEGEKEFITLRTTNFTPEVLKEAGSIFWKEAAILLNEILGRIAESLGLPAEALTVYSKPCMELDGHRRATMLRLFRYEVFDGAEPRVVAEGMTHYQPDRQGVETYFRTQRSWFTEPRRGRQTRPGSGRSPCRKMVPYRKQLYIPSRKSSCWATT